MKSFSHITDHNKITFNLWDKPHPTIFSKREKQIVKSIIDGVVHDFTSFMFTYLNPQKLPSEYKFEHPIKLEENVKYSLCNYYKVYRLVHEYSCVINHLEQEGYIYLNPYGENPRQVPFLIYIPDKNRFQYPSSGLVQLCQSVISKIIEPDIEELKKFYKHNCLDEITFNDKRNKNRQTFFTFCLVLITLLTSLVSLCISNGQLKQAKELYRKSQNDTTFVKILQIPDQSQTQEKLIESKRSENIPENQINRVPQNNDTVKAYK